MRFIYGLILVLLMYPSIVNAQNCPNSGSYLHAGYINGMITTFDRALGNFEAVIDGLDSILSSPGHDVKWALHYNNDEALIDQLEQLVDQKTDDEVARLYAVITSLLGDIRDVDMQELGEDATLIEEIRQIINGWYEAFLVEIEALVAEAAARANDYAWLNDADLASMVSNIKDDIDMDCRKILLLPHSQGNFYANAIWSKIYRETSNGYPINAFKVLGQLSLGAPTSSIGGGLASGRDDSDITGWINHGDDIILNLMQGLGLSILPTNTNAATNDLSAHGLIETFLGAPEIAAMVASSAASIAANLEPMPLMRSGIGSSALQEVGYNDFDEILDVKFASDSTEYRYYGVPSNTYRSLLSAPSAGAYFNVNIRMEFDHYKFY